MWQMEYCAYYADRMYFWCVFPYVFSYQVILPHKKQMYLQLQGVISRGEYGAHEHPLGTARFLHSLTKNSLREFVSIVLWLIFKGFYTSGEID